MKYREILLLESRALFTDAAILLTVFGGVLLYFFLYPLPYTQQVPRNQEVVVVNLDNSPLSRQFERMVNATPQVHLTARAYSLNEAKDIFLERKLAGILVIPENFHRDLLLGHRPTLSFAGDASYFLVYGTVLEGMMAAGDTLAAQVKVQRMIMGGQALALAEKQVSAIGLNLVPVFNQTMGYVNYVIPPVFILILHQTLILAAGTMGGKQNEPQPLNSNTYWRRAPPWRLLVIRTGLFMTIYWFLTLYYMGFSFSYYSIPRLADTVELILLILPFLLNTTLFGICLGLLLPRRELATLLVLISSMPLIFISGFIWPTSSIPTVLVIVSQAIPVIPAIEAFLTLNQMGAEFSDILPRWNQLWLGAVVYGALAWWLLQRRRAPQPQDSL